MQFFKAPKESLGNLDADTAARLLAVTTDIALILDANGVIRDVSSQSSDFLSELAGSSGWIGRHWADTVSESSQSKIPSLLEEAASKPLSRWRELYHKAASGPDIPILYSVVQIRPDERFVAAGRDIRSLAAMQQRLVEAQLSLERDYARVRQAETRYRVLFQNSSEPLFVIDAATGKVIEANPAAARVFGPSIGRVVGRNFPSGVDADGLRGLRSVMNAMKAGENFEEDVCVQITENRKVFFVSTTMYRQDSSNFFLMRFTAIDSEAQPSPATRYNSRLIGFLRQTPDGYVVVDQDGRILTANPAFLQMAQIMNEDQARGELIERWFGRSIVDIKVLIANLRQSKSVSLFATLMRGEYGTAEDVEISAVELEGGEQPTFGLAIRNVGSRNRARTRIEDHRPKSVEQIKDLIGRVSLKEMVRESTDMIERLCIEAALELTSDNRATAAEMLGLSRQSLYVRLRRYGLANSVESARESQSQ